jgi:hypothetical protein
MSERPIFIVPTSCRRCHDFRAELKNGNVLVCIRCGKEHGPIGKNITGFIDAVVAQFGGVEQVIIHNKKRRRSTAEPSS